MDFPNIFRSFFRFDETNDEFFDRNSNNFDNNSNHFNDFESEMNRDFEDIVHSFGQMFDIFNRFSVINDLNDRNSWQELETQAKSPRDLMIKSDEDNGSVGRPQDLDFDKRVAEKGLNSIFTERPKKDLNSFRNTFTTTYSYTSLNNNGVFDYYLTFILILQ